ncbi:MAG: hypothetical protein QM689_08670 [Oscillospiraceae bacterium]
MKCIGVNCFRSKKGIPTMILHCVSPMRLRTDGTNKGESVETLFVPLTMSEEILGVPANNVKIDDYCGHEINAFFNRSGFVERVEVVN